MYQSSPIHRAKVSSTDTAEYLVSGLDVDTLKSLAQCFGNIYTQKDNSCFGVTLKVIGASFNY